MITKKLTITIILLLGITFPLASQDSLKDLKAGLETIRPMDPYNYCKEMAKPEYGGRFTGHEGYTAAAEWAAGKFEEWGLLPISDETGYLQEYPSPYTVVDEAEMTVFIEKKNEADESVYDEKSLEIGADFLPLLFTDSGDFRAGAVFVGWGISAPELGYDDYEKVNVEGKYVLCFRGTPDPRNYDFDKHDHHRHRMKTAKEKGALGLIYIYPKPIANPNGEWIENFTPAIISEDVADMFFEEKGFTSSDLKSDLRTYKQPISFEFYIHFYNAEGFYYRVNKIKKTEADGIKSASVFFTIL